jgi:hypothetical protein
MHAAEQPAAETLLTAFRTIKPAERQKHGQVLDYWRSIRGDKEFPPLHDLDPLEISDAGPCSILLELIGGGQDAEVRHLGEALKEDVTVQRIIDAPNPSVLSCISKKLPIVAISREFLAFEDSFDNADGWTRCWVTLLPLSSCGSWVDYVYAFVSVETNRGNAAKAPEISEAVDVPTEDVLVEDVVAEVAENVPAEVVVAEEAEVVTDVPAIEPEVAADAAPFVGDEPDAPLEEAVEPVDVILASNGPDAPLEEAVEPEEAIQADNEPEPEEPAKAPAAKGSPGFSKLIEGFANLTGFYGQTVQVDTVVEGEPPADEPPAIEPEAIEPPLELEEPAPVTEPEAIEPAAEPEEPAPALEPVAADPPTQPQETAPAMEGTLQSKLTDVRAKAEEARMASLRATAALHEGLSAAYDFALDAESSPEEYLRLVEAQGMKIQLRAPMAPVAKLAFDGQCDDATMAELEAVLAWALKQELPRGSLAARIDEAGGLAGILNGNAQPS